LFRSHQSSQLFTLKKNIKKMLIFRRVNRFFLIEMTTIVLFSSLSESCGAFFGYCPGVLLKGLILDFEIPNCNLHLVNSRIRISVSSKNKKSREIGPKCSLFPGTLNVRAKSNR